MVEEKVFFSKKKDMLENEALKMQGYQYENSATLEMEKEGFYIIIKAEEDWFKKDEVKEGLKDSEEVSGDEKAKVLAKLKELEESAGAGISMFD